MTKKVLFKKISIQNFLSIGHEPVVIEFKRGLHIVTGINRDLADRRNGIGKSTILDALCFALFGNTLRDLKKEFITNNITRKTSIVSLEFQVAENNKVTDYKLVRTLEPSKCYLYEGGIDITRDSMVNTTQFVLKLLKLTPEIFQNCIAMTVNNMVPFMAKKKIEKRKFIENIFNLEVFSAMNSNLKNEILDTKKELEVLNGKYYEVKNTYDNICKQSKDSEDLRANRKETLLNRLSQNNIDLKSIEEKLSKIQILDLSKVEDKITLAEKKVEEIVTKINSVGKDITSLETKRDFRSADLLKIGTKKDECPICLKPISNDDKDHIKKKKQEIQSQIDNYDKDIEVLNNKLSVYEESRTKLLKAISQLKEIVEKQKLQKQQKSHLKQKYSDIENYNTTIEKDLKDLEQGIQDFTSLIEDQKQRIDTLTNELQKVKNEQEVLEVVKFVLGEDGVRSYIVKKILLLFNSKLSNYLRKLNSNAFIKFDEYFEETIINSNGTEVCYFNFSGAEKKVIDLAIMFTFIEMLKLQGNTLYNIQFYDELLDTSLDEAGVEMVVSLLTSISSNNNCGIYIISHRKECSKLSTGDIIYLEKKDSITKRVEFVD